MQTYKFDDDTKEYLCAEEAFLDPLETEQQGKEIYLLPADSTFTEPLKAKEGYAVCWTGKAWEYIEDHRQKRDKGGVIVEGTGTPYWMPGDNWKSSARYMTKLGPLPEGALREAPAKPAEVIERENLENRLNTAQEYLDDTDWYCARYVDTGIEIPADIKEKWQAARKEVSEAREELDNKYPKPSYTAKYFIT